MSTLVPPDEGVTTNKSIDEDDEICPRTVTDENISYIFRTYKSPFTKDNEPTRYKGTLNGKNITVASSLRASTAAPVYFERKTMSICGSSFIDGGVTNNNPSEIALSEIPLDSTSPENFELMIAKTREYLRSEESFNKLIKQIKKRI